MADIFAQKNRGVPSGLYGVNLDNILFMNRRYFLKNATFAAGTIYTLSSFNNLLQAIPDNTEPFPFLDLHVHTTDTFTIEQILQIGQERKVNFGIVAHPAPWALKDDADLKKYIDQLRQYPVYIGLQPTYLGWRKNYSSELLAQVDYILMDPQMVPQGNGKIWQIWEYDTYIENTDDFMNRYMDYALEILNNESINIFAWPLFLPVCIAKDYYTLWTEERMQQLIHAAKKQHIAFEINDLAHTPHAEFILKAKAEGIKFTFGSDSRNRNVGRLAYCKRMLEKCGLTKDDFYTPLKP